MLSIKLKHLQRPYVCELRFMHSLVGIFVRFALPLPSVPVGFVSWIHWTCTIVPRSTASHALLLSLADEQPTMTLVLKLPSTARSDDRATPFSVLVELCHVGLYRATFVNGDWPITGKKTVLQSRVCDRFRMNYLLMKQISNI
jgi:hypothetical protein